MKIGKNCVACGTCIAVCPFDAIRIIEDKTAVIDNKKCKKCGICIKACPLGVIG